MAKSPAVILFDVAGNPMAVEDGVAIPVGTTGIVAAGSDGTDAHFLLVDSAGRPVVAGAGVAGTPAGGVVSVQGVAGGTAVPISGTVTATNPSTGTNNAAAPGSSTQIGGTDGSNLQAARIFDADSGAGTQYVLGTILRKSASGGSVEAGTSADPLRIDPTGTTTQPVSAASLPLPTGAATETTLATRLADATFTGRINTLGQKTMANSTPVVLSSDQTVIPVSDNGGSLTVDGTVTSNQGTAAALSGHWPVQVTDGTNTMPTADNAARSIFTRTTDGTTTAAVKAASTAAIASDPALVVAISPNNTITTSNASVGANNAALPSSSTEIGGSDGTNLQAIRVFDGDSGVGTQYVLGSILRKSASGGTVEAGTATDPMRVDPTGTTTQPVSASSLPLPTGAATEATLATRLADATFTGRINTLGQKTSANSTPVVLASDQSAIPITDNAGSLTVDSTQLPAALVGGRLDENVGAWLGSTAPTVGSKTSANSVPVVIASDQGAVPVSGTVTANIGTSGALALDTTLTGGTQKAIVRGGAKGATTAADVTSTAEGTDHQAVDIQIYHGGAAINPTAIRALTSSDVVTAAQGTAAALAGYWPTRVTDGTNTMPTADTAGRSIFTRTTDGTNTAAVKAASTAAVAADPALVVAISPNNTVTTSNASVGANNAAIPTSSTEIGGSDGTNLQAIRVFDGDSGAGTQYVLGAILRKGASGGTVEAGTSADPLRVDPTGTTTQPVSAASLPLPTGAATETTLATRLADATFTARINTLGQKTMANSTPVVLSSDQTVIPVSDNGGSLTVDGTVTANIGTTNGLALDATLTGGTARTKITDGTTNAAVKAASTAAVAADPALVVAISPNNPISVSGTADATGTGALGALNATVQVTTAGLSSVGFQLAAGTLVGTIVPEISFDSGTTWVATYLSDPATSIKSSSVVFGIANTATSREIVGIGGSGLTRIRVSAYTSGTANITVRASLVDGSSLARVASTGATYTTITSPTALSLGLTAQVSAYGTLKVSSEGSEIFVDPFDGSVIDTTNRWTQTVVGSGTASISGGVLTLATGTTASNAAALNTQTTFRPVGLSFQVFGCTHQLEAVAVTNAHHFWGLGTVPGSWTALTPLQDAIGFEQDTTGALNAVVYNAGTRTIVAVLTRPSDAAQHRYAIWARADTIFWYLDTLEYPVASANFQLLGQQVLPIRLHLINHTSGPASGPTDKSMGVGLSESSHSGVQISDGTFAWRKTTVDAQGRLQIVTTCSGPTLSSVSGSASSVTLLSANSARVGATVFNDSTAILYVKFGTTASTTSFTVRLVSNSYYEVPFGYTGRIDGIWASATGNARLTEIT